jgi:hypothetical protein
MDTSEKRRKREKKSEKGECRPQRGGGRPAVTRILAYTSKTKIASE